MKLMTDIVLTITLSSGVISCVDNTPSVAQAKPFRSKIIHNPVFEQVVEVDHKHFASNGVDYIFDISIPKNTKLPVIFVQEMVPLHLLPTIYPECSRLIVIVPNWPFYQENASQKLPKGVACAEPTASSIVYEFNRESGQLLMDSLIIIGGFPEMKYAEQKEMTSKEKEIYYIESYASNCCPRDRQWDNKPTREEFISFFQDKNQTKIVETYQKATGKEGEISYYYTLDGLSNTMKLKFIKERDFYRTINRQNKDIIVTPRIYTPTIVEINDSFKKI